MDYDFNKSSVANQMNQIRGVDTGTDVFARQSVEDQVAYKEGIIQSEGPGSIQQISQEAQANKNAKQKPWGYGLLWLAVIGIIIFLWVKMK
jgi:hypothetical protein